MKKRNIWVLASYFLLISFNGLAADHKNHQLYGSHGMVLLKHKDIGLIVSHLPLYGAPHNYQIIYQVDIKDSAKLNSIEDGLITLLPENFDLKALIDQEPLTVDATIFDGHFERGGTAAFNSTVTFKKAVLIEQLATDLSNDLASFYSVKINQSTHLAIHKIQQSPSFDAIGLIDTAKIKQLNSCKTPKNFSHNALSLHLKTCGIENLLYVEVQDFSR